MAKYMLARGQTRLPIDGIRETPRVNDKPLRTTETVLFSPGKVVESDLDFGPWVKEGVLVRLDVRPTLRPDPKPAAAPKMILPTPIPAQVEVIKEVPKVEKPLQPAESHITTNPAHKPVEAPAAPVEQIKFADEIPPVDASEQSKPLPGANPEAAGTIGGTGEVDAVGPDATLTRTEEEPEEEEAAPKGKAETTKQIARGSNRNKRRR